MAKKWGFSKSGECKLNGNGVEWDKGDRVVHQGMIIMSGKAKRVRHADTDEAECDEDELVETSRDMDITSVACLIGQRRRGLFPTGPC